LGRVGQLKRGLDVGRELPQVRLIRRDGMAAVAPLEAQKIEKRIHPSHKKCPTSPAGQPK